MELYREIQEVGVRVKWDGDEGNACGEVQRKEGMPPLTGANE
jgi:hypothetical protein